METKMINSKEEFAQIWKKEPKELHYLDYFIFLLINELDSLLQSEYFQNKSEPGKYHLNKQEVSDLALQLGDGLKFFYEQICFGSGCSLGCPNKLDKPFTKNEEDVRLEIRNVEFDGSNESCSSRDKCLQHDLLNYVALDTITDFYTYDMNLVSEVKDKEIVKLASFVVKIIVRLTIERGAELLKDPYKTDGLVFN